MEWLKTGIEPLKDLIAFLQKKSDTNDVHKRQVIRELKNNLNIFKNGYINESSYDVMIDLLSNDAMKQAIEGDQRLQLEVKREQQFYADQSEGLSKFISYLGTTISIIFSIGAIIGAMITMYASVASRTSEIGTLRALGFSRTAILIAFLGESLLLGLVGGVVGLAAASFMQMVPISTTNFQTFSEIAFTFTLTPLIVLASLAFAVFMGFVGGFLPAARAARLSIVDALRAA